MTINTIADLASARNVPVRELKRDIKMYTDYDTVILWDDRSVTLCTIVPEAMAQNTKTLKFPFEEEDFDDTLSGLQCWADSVWCEHKEKGDC